jgi:hypothetical protein
MESHCKSDAAETREVKEMKLAVKSRVEVEEGSSLGFEP